MSTFSVTVAVCAHRQIQAQTYENLRALENCPDPKVTVRLVDGDALISRSRSRAATHFLKTNKDELLMFIDDDIVIKPFDASQLMQEAYKLNLPIVGAAYVTKTKERPGLAIRPLTTEKIEFGKNGKIHEMRSISTGCMVIRREVLTKFINEGVAPLCRHGTTGYYPFFQHQKMVIDGVWEDVSEDWYFCEKARKLGFSVWCDTTIKLGHIGPYEYNWDDMIEIRAGHRKTYDKHIFNVIDPHTLIEKENLPSQKDEATPIKA